jgi:hypothetical protein
MIGRGKFKSASTSATLLLYFPESIVLLGTASMPVGRL